MSTGAAHRLGLTGGIGSGKSTVAALLAGRGAAVIDADALSRACTAPGGAAIAAIAQAFGAQFIGRDGALDRDAMRARVFQDPGAKAALEQIIHPLVGQQAAQAAAAAEQAGAPCIVFDIPLLVESNRWRPVLHRVLVVDCEPATQIRRVMARSGLGEAEVVRIMQAQAPRARRLAAADLVVFNEGLSLDALAGEVGQIAAQFGL